MIYLFYGSDVDKARTKAFAWVAAARVKEPNLAYVRLAKEELSDAALEEAGTSHSLFAKRTLTLIDDPFAKARASEEGEGDEEKESTSVLEDYLDRLAASENVIVILAPKLLAAKAKKIAAKAKLEYRFDLPPTREFKRGFNSGLVDALAAKNREKLWLELTRAMRQGDAPEMLHALLHWKARDIMEKGSRMWTPSEARKLSIDLITLLQESRRKGVELGERLERFVLVF